MTMRSAMIAGAGSLMLIVPLAAVQTCGKTDEHAMAVVPREMPVATVTLDEPLTTHLSRRDIPPGDPIISVSAPSDARRVTAYFPFGLTKELAYDDIQKMWRGRFLVPEGIPDGEYTITLGVELSDGERLNLKERYRLDSNQDEFLASFEHDVVWPGELVSLAVDSVEPARDVYAHCPALGWHRLKLLPQDRLSPTRYRLNRMLPDDTEPGEYLVLVVVRDKAGNRLERHIMLSVVALPSA